MGAVTRELRGSCPACTDCFNKKGPAAAGPFCLDHAEDPTVPQTGYSDVDAAGQLAQPAESLLAGQAGSDLVGVSEGSLGLAR